MSKFTPGCGYYGSCTTISNWVANDPVLSWMVNVLIILGIIGLVLTIVWYLRDYRKRPFCVDCLKHDDERVRTRFIFGDEPVCSGHWDERDMASEEVYKCPKHVTDFHKEKHSGTTIDRCPHGCVFLDADELDAIVESAEDSGAAAGTVLGMALGSSIGASRGD